MATSISSYNQTVSFTYCMRETRLLKCAKMIESLRPGSMLDVGCSTGDWLIRWRERGWEPHGIDIDADNISVALDRAIDAKFCDLNAESIPFSDACFDLVFAGEVIEHLIDTDRFISEIARVTKPSGHVIITTPNLASFENRLRIVLGIYPAWVNYNLEGSGHVRAYTPRVLKAQMSKHGFHVIKHVGNWVPFLPQRFVDDIKMPWLRFTGDIFPSLAMDIMVLAQRYD
jgi:ubiquinone/menaquinone biosynthesis C-methylase UbiE